ncbi:MAG: membrane protein [Chloroflexota bacterium]|jgi:uncharacterized membrane protein|nr:DUF1269 domain-containing protein [Caldilinea sp.]GIK74738.1 MAG: membrane protein [Chloroflexota bacterium]
MNDNPVQVLVAAFNDPNRAAEIMAELKQGKKEGLIGIIDAAVVVKDAEGKLKVKDAKRRSRKGLITGGIVGGVLGLLAGPVGWMAVGGGAIGALAGKAAGSGLKATMEEIGAALTPNSSAIVAVVEHKWVGILESMLAAEGARLAMDAIKEDIATQLNAGGSVLFTAVGGTQAASVMRAAETPEGVQISAIGVSDDGVFIGDAQLVTDEEIIDGEATLVTSSDEAKQ